METYVVVEAIEQAVVPDQRELAPRPRYSDIGFVDPSEGSQGG